MFVLSIGTFQSCKKDDNSATPVIERIRLTTGVNVLDTTVKEVSWGQNIAIVGHDLQDVVAVYFNDVKATLNPPFVSSNAIVCTVPSSVPGVITNKVKVVTADGQEVSFPLKTKLPKPVISGLYNEMAAQGSTTSLLGSYFYFVKKVTFGDAVADLVSTSPTDISIKIPATAKPGDIVTLYTETDTVKSNFGYKDAGLWLLDFDNNATGWGSKFCWGNLAFRSDEKSISANYGAIEGTSISPTTYTDKWLASTCYFDYGYGTLDPSKMVLKFEVRADLPWTWSSDLADDDHATLYIMINGDEANRVKFHPQTDIKYRSSGFTTNGWMTVTLPLSNYLKSTSITDVRVSWIPNKQSYDKFASYVDNVRICTIK